MKNGCLKGLSCFGLLLISPLILVALLDARIPRIDYMERQLQRNKEELVMVVDFITALDFEMVSIQRPFEARVSDMFVGSRYGRIPIDDERYLVVIQNLFNRGFRVISKDEKAVSFLRWSTRNHGRGIVYSLDGTTPDEESLTFLTEIEPLTEDRWYFYVEDFHVWRRSN